MISIFDASKSELLQACKKHVIFQSNSKKYQVRKRTVGGMRKQLKCNGVLEIQKVQVDHLPNIVDEKEWIILEIPENDNK